MTGSLKRPRFLVGLFLALLAIALQGVQGEEELGVSQVPSEVQCRPYIEKALKDLGTGSLEESSTEVGDNVDDDEASPFNEQSDEPTETDNDNDNDDVADDSAKEASTEDNADNDSVENVADNDGQDESGEGDELAAADESAKDGDDGASSEDTDVDDIDNVETVEITSAENETDNQSNEEANDTDDDDQQKDENSNEDSENGEEQDEGVAVDGSNEEAEDNETENGSKEEKEDSDTAEEEDVVAEESKEGDSNDVESIEDHESSENKTVEDKSAEEDNHSNSEEKVPEETQDENSAENKDGASVESSETQDDVEVDGDNTDDDNVKKDDDDHQDSTENAKESVEDTVEDVNDGEDATKESTEDVEAAAASASVESPDDDTKSVEESEEVKSRDRRDVEEKEGDDDKASEGGDDKEETDQAEGAEDEEKSEDSEDDDGAEPTPEEDLIQEIEVPENLRPREHINQLLKLDEENEEKERAIGKAADTILRDLKRLYDTAIKPLETLYKYRDLSNRHFGDPEIFSKPLVLFMGPWSGGKSSIVNYLLDNEYKSTSLRTGAEPSPAYFNILMHGEEEEILDGTQLAADWTFSGLQKFGQGMLDRLRGVKLKNKLLEKVNIVEIPGILEIRKQVQRLFPFNDACQWFIDRADIIFLVYDPAKLDVGPETEAILDQLKGREYQTRIILNKADQVKPEELMRVQGALIWNISPLMSSSEPPVMYSTSLWSLPYEAGAPTRLLYAQERAFLRDLRSAIDKRVEHKIASARRFAVRVRNHAKMVDCYLTTYYNHKGFFGSKKDISDKIIENPQDYHIYEGLSTLTNISRYDLPDPDVYKDFFRLNNLYDFQQLSSTCTYFRGCPINRLDIAIAYDLPELVGKYKKSVEAAMHEGETSPPPS